MTADVRVIGANATLNSVSTNVAALKAPGSVSPASMPLGYFRKIVCVATNTAAAYINDSTSTASGSGTIWSVGSGGMAVGAVTTLDWPLFAGLSFASGGGTFSLAWD